MSWRDGMSWEEYAELCEAYRIRFRNGEIDENSFRRLMGKAGFNATEIDAEVKDNEP